MLSVVLCTYNGEHFVEACIESVMQQDIDKSMFELVIVDDASTDSTPEILKRMEEKYTDNIVLILKDEHHSVTRLSNRNVGVEYATGDYIMFLDQDDWYRQDAFRILHQAMERDPELDYIEYAFYWTNKAGEVQGMSGQADGAFYKYKLAEESDRNEYAKKFILPGHTYAWCRIYRKSFLVDNQIKHNDGEMVSGYRDNFFAGLTALYCTCFAKWYEPLYFYRIYLGSDSHAKSKNDKGVFERCKVGLFLYEEYERRGLLEKNREMTEFMFLVTILKKPFWTLLEQFDPIPYSVLAFIQDSVRTLCPDYEKNAIAKSWPELEQLFVIMKHDWTPEFLSALKERYGKQ